MGPRHHPGPGEDTGLTPAVPCLRMHLILANSPVSSIAGDIFKLAEPLERNTDRLRHKHEYHGG